MRTALLTTLLFLLPVLAQGQIRAFEYVGGPRDLNHVLTQERHGAYAFLKSFDSGDTLTVWLQHVGGGNPPHYASADLADLVVWCYPERYPHESHPFPEARIVEIRRQRDLVWIAPEESFKD